MIASGTTLSSNTQEVIAEGAAVAPIIPISAEVQRRPNSARPGMRWPGVGRASSKRCQAALARASAARCVGYP